jgi:hypothetical protein
MKTKYKLLTIIFPVVITVAWLSGCSEDELLNKSPKDQATQAGFFRDAATARQSVISCFSPLLHYETSYRSRFMHALEVGTDNMKNRPTGQLWRIQMDLWTFDATHEVNQGGMRNWWPMYYQVINNANYAIEGIPGSSDVNFTTEMQKPYIAVARLMRAFAYMNLSIFWGDVPLHDKFITGINEVYIARTPRSEVMNLVIEDLKYAKENLPLEWKDADKGFPTKAAGAGILAKAYLWAADFRLLDNETGASDYFIAAENAADEAINIADECGYSLMADFEHMMDIKSQHVDNTEFIFYLEFKENSEAIGELSNIGIVERACGEPKISVYGAGWQAIFPSRDLYETFETTPKVDPRRGYSIWAPGDFYGIYHGTATSYQLSPQAGGGEKAVQDGDSIFYDFGWSQTNLNIKKIWTPVKDLNNGRESGYDIPLLRYAELLLFSAEAKIENNKIAEGMAQLNKVRARPSVNMPPLTATDQADARDKLRHERRVELCLEGHRYHDLLRWDIVEEVMSKPIKTVYGDDSKTKGQFCKFPKNKLWPIPQIEIDANPLMVQNPGY